MTERRPKAKSDYHGDTSGASFDYWWDELGWWTEQRKPRRKADQ